MISKGILRKRLTHLEQKMSIYWGKQEELYRFYAAQRIEILYLIMLEEDNVL